MRFNPWALPPPWRAATIVPSLPVLPVRACPLVPPTTPRLNYLVSLQSTTAVLGQVNDPTYSVPCWYALLKYIVCSLVLFALAKHFSIFL